MQYTLYHGKCESLLPELADNSVDSCATDPPYELGFMGKRWDASGIAYNVDMWREVYRVLKPGGYLLAFGGTRTHHRMACAIEDAGFEIRDCIEWVYGSGFPKSLDISKAIDKVQGAEREVIGQNQYASRRPHKEYIHTQQWGKTLGGADTALVTTPATDAARQWDGWGTALKPAHEPIVVARKPLAERTVASNVLAWGTGAINVDACRVPTDENRSRLAGHIPTQAWGLYKRLQPSESNPQGRWPSNLILTHHPDCNGACVEGCPVKLMDEQSGNRKAGGNIVDPPSTTALFGTHGRNAWQGYNDEGGASRFFPVMAWEDDDFEPFRYVAKASRRERNEGCDGLPEHEKKTLNDYRLPSEGRTASKSGAPMSNHHPTVKPKQIMKWLCTLVTPPGGVVLDPFTGSGTTGVACMEAGFQFVGIEREDAYIEIARARIAAAQTAQQLPLQEAGA